MLPRGHQDGLRAVHHTCIVMSMPSSQHQKVAHHVITLHTSILNASSTPQSHHVLPPSRQHTQTQTQAHQRRGMLQPQHHLSTFASVHRRHPAVYVCTAARQAAATKSAAVTVLLLWSLPPCCCLLLVVWVFLITPHQQLDHVQGSSRDACAWAIDGSHAHVVQLLMILCDRSTGKEECSTQGKNAAHRGERSTQGLNAANRECCTQGLSAAHRFVCTPGKRHAAQGRPSVRAQADTSTLVRASARLRP